MSKPKAPSNKGQPVKAGRKGAAPKPVLKVKAAFFRWVNNTTVDAAGNPVFEDAAKSHHLIDVDKERLRLQQREKFVEDRPVELLLKEFALKGEGKHVDLAVITGKMEKSTGLFAFDKIDNKIAKTNYTVDTVFDILDPDGKVIRADVPLRLPPRDGDGAWEILLGAKDGNIEWHGDYVSVTKPYPPLRYNHFLGAKFKPYGTLTPACNFPGGGDRAEFTRGRGGKRVDTFVVHCMCACKKYPEELDKWYDPVINHRIFTDERAASSAHYIIDRDGVVYEAVEPEHRAWHVAVSDWNYRGIGAELLGLHDGVRLEMWNKRTQYEKKIQALKKEIADLEKKIEKEKNDKKRAQLEKQVQAKEEGIDRRQQWIDAYDDRAAHAQLNAYTDAQYESLANLCKCLKERYEFQYLVGHEEIQANKKDPGKKFEWPRIESVFPGVKRKR